MNYLVTSSPFIFFLLIGTACGPNNKELREEVRSVNPSHFIWESLVEEITRETRQLSEGSTAECYKIVVKSVPHEHTMGPWCPRHIEDSREKGGIWFENGKVYDVDGHFIASIGTFYADEKWNLYNENGSIKVTDSQEACEGAAKPNVEEIYKNHCVECQPSFYSDHLITYYLPIHPIYLQSPAFRRRGAMGLAFNGVILIHPPPQKPYWQHILSLLWMIAAGM